MEWKTLQEVFEENGSVFPFDVLFNISLISFEMPIEKITFVKKIDKDLTEIEWYPRDYEKNVSNLTDFKKQKHICWAKYKDYISYKGTQFDKDIKNLLDN